jgi:CRP-like cAMP-binding protein
MKEIYQRSGLDRREKIGAVANDRRQNNERRTSLHDLESTIAIMKKIPLFSGFSDEQYLKVQRICSRRTIQKDNFVYYEGEESNDLFILLKGRLRLTLKGVMLSMLYPMCMVGEIGVFTEGNRSVSVLVDEEAVVIRFPKEELFNIMRNDLELSNRLLQNVVNDLVEKLKEDNRIIVELRKEKNSMLI